MLKSAIRIFTTRDCNKLLAKLGCNLLRLGNLLSDIPYLLKYLFYFRKPIRQLRHLHFSASRSIVDVLVNRDCNEKIRTLYFRDRLVIFTAMPKSASSVIASCAAEMMPISETRWTGAPKYLSSLQDSDFNLELVKATSKGVIPKGGVLKFHAHARDKNLRVLNLLGVKYIILCRHPADQLVAMYCHILSLFKIEKAMMKRPLLINDVLSEHVHIYPVFSAMFEDHVSLDETLQYMICEGYLNASLTWIVDWLRFRDPSRSLLLRYEDFIRNKEKVFTDLSRFLQDQEPDPDTLMKSHAIAGTYKKKRTSGNDNTRKYPRGWTGKIGTCKDYFSVENNQAYRSVVEGFLNYYPGASRLLERYPNLLDIDHLDENSN